MTYDKAGHKLGLEDPNLGDWQYGYDRQGRLIWQYDANNKRTCLFYDGMERLAAKQFTTGNCPATPPATGAAQAIRYTYGTSGASTGQVTQVTRTGDGGGLWSTRGLTYDSVGRVITETATITERVGAVATGYRYDAYNRPNLTIYPDGEQVIVEYNSMGLPARLTSRVQGVDQVLVNGTAVGGASQYTVQYDVAGRPVKTKYAAGGDLWRTQTFAPFTQATQGGLLTAIDIGTQASPGAQLHLGYAYDEFGNVTTLTENTTGNTLTYDGQNRVTGAFGPSYSYQPSGRFDRFVGLTFAYGTGYAAGSNRSPLHGVVSTAAGGDFDYDLNGNMVSRRTTSAAPVQTLTWSQANELLSVTTGTTVESYRYDADGQRIYQESKTGGNPTWRHFDYFPHYTGAPHGAPVFRAGRSGLCRLKLDAPARDTLYTAPCCQRAASLHNHSRKGFSDVGCTVAFLLPARCAALSRPCSGRLSADHAGGRDDSRTGPCCARRGRRRSLVRRYVGGCDLRGRGRAGLPNQCHGRGRRLHGDDGHSPAGRERAAGPLDRLRRGRRDVRHPRRGAAGDLHRRVH